MWTNKFKKVTESANGILIYYFNIVATSSCYFYVLKFESNLNLMIYSQKK